MAEATKTRYALVTGANKGIGFGTCEQLLATDGIVVILTARDEKRGLEAAEKLKGRGFSDRVMFHQLDVADQESVASLAEYVRTRIGKLDILVNNAGIGGIEQKSLSGDLFRDLVTGEEEARRKLKELSPETLGLAEECLNINYYGPKRLVEALVSLLQLSDSPTIVNVSSIAGMLKNIPNEEVKDVLGDVNNLKEERVDDVLREFVKDFKEGSWDTKGWPPYFSAYTLSKASLNAYTRMIARRYPSFRINCVCPGFVKTDINSNGGYLSIEEGAESVVRLALLPNGGPSGRFFSRQEESPF